MDAEITMRGLDDISAMLDQLQPKQAAKILREGVKAGEQVFAAAVREKAPELKEDAGGNALPPGFLKSDITVRVTTAADGTIIGTVGPGKLSKHVAKWVESGHKRVRRQRRFGKNRGKMVTNTERPTPAYPFVRPAFEESAQAAVEAAEAAIVEGFKKAGVLK